MAIGADDDAGRNAELADAAHAAGVPVNVVDAPELSTVIVPAIVDRDPVVVAIGTEGAAPIIARDLRARIESWLPADFGRVATYAAALRPRVRDAIAQPAARRQFWERLLRGPFRDRALAADVAGAEQEATRALRDAGKGSHGSVVLVGCGPGDPDLLTLKALQALQDADVLVHDRLVNPAILDYARRDAVRIDVGKAPGGKATPQDEINRILVREALKGQRVARLKGGDAMVFGRAAEEIAAARAAGIDVTVIPGITAAHAIAASVTLPLTLRGKVRQFAVVTGATEDGAADLDWRALAAPGQGFAIYMGVRSAAVIEQQSPRRGRRPRNAGRHRRERHAAPGARHRDDARGSRRGRTGRGRHGARHHLHRLGLGRGLPLPPCARPRPSRPTHRSRLNSTSTTPRASAQNRSEGAHDGPAAKDGAVRAGTDRRHQRRSGKLDASAAKLARRLSRRRRGGRRTGGSARRRGASPRSADAALRQRIRQHGKPGAEGAQAGATAWLRRARPRHGRRRSGNAG